jgi:hypothetical protein
MTNILGHLKFEPVDHPNRILQARVLRSPGDLLFGLAHEPGRVFRKDRAEPFHEIAELCCVVLGAFRDRVRHVRREQLSG